MIGKVTLMRAQTIVSADGSNEVGGGFQGGNVKVWERVSPALSALDQMKHAMERDAEFRALQSISIVSLDQRGGKRGGGLDNA